MNFGTIKRFMLSLLVVAAAALATEMHFTDVTPTAHADASCDAIFQNLSADHASFIKFSSHKGNGVVSYASAFISDHGTGTLTTQEPSAHQIFSDRWGASNEPFDSLQYDVLYFVVDPSLGTVTYYLQNWGWAPEPVTSLQCANNIMYGFTPDNGLVSLTFNTLYTK